MKYGEYVRTSEGEIDINISNCDGEENVEGNKFFYDKEMIVNYSKNIIDLIENGDIIEYSINSLTKRIGQVAEYINARAQEKYLGVEGFNLNKIKIYRVLTKERFGDESFRVGGEDE